MSEFPEDSATRIWRKVKDGEIDHQEVFRIPAGYDYPWGEEVGFVKAKGYLFAVNWLADGNFGEGRFGIDTSQKGCFPSATKWMITNNKALDYGLYKTGGTDEAYDVVKKHITDDVFRFQNETSKGVIIEKRISDSERAVLRNRLHTRLIEVSQIEEKTKVVLNE